MPVIHIDGQEYEVKAGDNLLQACLGLGLDLPYFCWHPAMGSIGACRQCAVVQYLNADDQRGRIDFRSIRFPGLISAVTMPTGGTSDYASEMLHNAAFIACACLKQIRR